MKNAMKKLTSLLLVALLLVGMIPFGASAACPWVDVVYELDANGNPSKYVRCQVNPETNLIYEESINEVRAAIAGLNPAITSWSFNGQTGSLGSINFMNINEAVNVYPIFAEKVVPATYTVNVDYRDGRYVAGAVITDGIEIGTDILPAAPQSNGRQFVCWSLADGTQINANWQAYAALNGQTIYANWNIVGCTDCGQTNGHMTTCPKYEAPNGSAGGNVSGGTSDNVGGSTASSMYVDVIITTTKTSGFSAGDYYRCNLVDGKITAADRNTVAGLIAGKNIGAWKRADNGTQAYSLVDFDFSGLKAPINIMPVLKTTTGGTTTGGTVSGSTSGSTTGTFVPSTTNKFPYNVYLNIYKDTMVGSPDKCIDITSGIALDGLVSLSEVKTVVANYYNAKNSYGIGFDGLYLASGNWVANYVADTQKYNEIAAGQMRQTGYVYINVMISNATAKGTYTADASNPKTGDSIYTAMTVMGVSAASLAAVMYFYNKKRMAL